MLHIGKSNKILKSSARYYLHETQGMMNIRQPNKAIQLYAYFVRKSIHLYLNYFTTAPRIISKCISPYFTLIFVLILKVDGYIKFIVLKHHRFKKKPTLLYKLYYYNINISLFRARITQYTTYIVYINLDEHSIELYLVDCVPSVHFSRLDSSGYIFLISFRTLVTIKADLLFCAVGQLIG